MVDDMFPFDDSPEGDGWAFASVSSDSEYWVLVLEKAIAKCFGSYEIIEGGKPFQAFGWLTGFPSHCLFHADVTDENDLWDQIIEAVKRKHPVVSSVNSDYLQNQTSSELRDKGLSDHHAYSLLDAVEVRSDKTQSEYSF
jgi:hypothetical protein